MRRLGVGGVLVAALLLAPTARAATITVGVHTDNGSGGCELRNAIIAANSDMATGGCVAGDPGPTVDTINFSLPANDTIQLMNALPPVSSDVNIVGPGSSLLTIDGQDGARPFDFQGAHTDSISGLMITNGFCGTTCGGEGGALRNAGTLTLTDVVVTGNSASLSGGMDAFPQGGGISSAGTLHLILSTVSNNTAAATGATNQNGADGGGIFSNGALTLDRSTVSNNHATATAGVGGTTNANGGGLDTNGSVTLTQSTISGNTVSATAGTTNTGRGGAIGTFNAVATAVILDRSTVAGNTVTVGAPVSTAAAGGIFSQGGSLAVTSSTISGNSAPASANLAVSATTKTIKNTIVSNPLGGGANCGGGVATSQGFNVDSGMSCGFTQPGDQQTTDPMLDATLANNGGPTQTLALLTGSPAIDKGLSSGGETSDQRGLARPSDFLSIANAAGGDSSDIGAFEVQSPDHPVTPLDTTPPDTFLNPRLRKRKHKVRFSFSSNEAGAIFLCSFDRAPFAPCAQPVKLAHLRPGKHRFSVEAKDQAGNVDPAPAVFKFRIKR